MSRVKMPHNNRMSSSTALKTNDIWSKTIGYDPYAANADAQSDQQSEAQKASLMLLARMSNLSGSESRGGCKRCGMLGHLSFQCRNAPLKQTAGLGPAEDSDDSDDSSASSQASLPPVLKERKESEKERPRKRSREEKDDDSHSGSEASASSSRDRNKEKRSHKDHKKHHKKDSKKKSKHERKSHERSR